MRKAILFLALLCSVWADSKWDPIADSKAVVIKNNARFTVLTSALIRIEYSAAGNGKFEDRASLAIVNRKLQVPQFTSKDNGAGVIIDTSDLTLTYTGGAFTASSLQIERKNNGGNKTWSFGATDDSNLLGTLRTLDGANGAIELDCKNQGNWQLFCTYGVISRSGWAVVDDTQRNRLVKNDAWEHWVDVAPCADSTDIYFFGHGHNYRRALSEFTMIGGNTPLPPRYVFGVWFSRYWAYSDFELRDVINQYEVHETPLDVLVTDMDWHITFYKEASEGKRDPAGETPGWVRLQSNLQAAIVYLYVPLSGGAFLRYSRNMRWSRCRILAPAEELQSPIYSIYSFAGELYQLQFIHNALRAPQTMYINDENVRGPAFGACTIFDSLQ